MLLAQGLVPAPALLVLEPWEPLPERRPATAWATPLNALLAAVPPVDCESVAPLWSLPAVTLCGLATMACGFAGVLAVDVVRAVAASAAAPAAVALATVAISEGAVVISVVVPLPTFTPPTPAEMLSAGVANPRLPNGVMTPALTLPVLITTLPLS